MDEQNQENLEMTETPTWKRKAAWGMIVLFGISIAIWLISIAQPDWVEIVRSWF